MNPMLLLLVVLAVVGGLLIHHFRRVQTAERWRHVAAQLGLVFTPGSSLSAPSLSGQIDNIAVAATVLHRRRNNRSVSYVQVTTRPALPMPSGLEVAPRDFGQALLELVVGQDLEVGDPALDHSACISAPGEEDVRALFEDEALRAACLELCSGSSRNRITGGQVILEKRTWSGHEVSDLLVQGVLLSKALDNARLRPWHTLAEDFGLALRATPQQITARGTIGGLTVEARSELQAGRAVILVPIPARLPLGLQVVSGEHMDAVPLGDPILDGKIAAIGAPAEVLRALLRGDTLRGELLSVLHAFPLSRVHSNQVELVLPMASTTALAERVQDACRLARALAEHAEHALGGGLMPLQRPQKQPH